MKIRLLVASLSLGTLAWSLGACTKHFTPEDLNTFQDAQEDDVKYLDPANSYDDISNKPTPAIYEGLYEYAYLSKPYKVVPLLAADMPKFSADRRTLTIPLRHDIKFQDDPCFKATHGKGRGVTAQDFIYSWKRLALPGVQSQGWWVLDGKVAGINAFHDLLVKTAPNDLFNVMPQPVEGLKALDDYTLQIKLLKPYPQLMYVLTMSFTAVVPHEAVEAYADARGNLNDKQVGTGPYRLKAWEHSHELVLERNPTYHDDFFPSEAAPEYRAMLSDAGKKLPFADKIIIHFVKEEQPRWLGFLKGSWDRLTKIPKDNFPASVQNKTELAPDLAKRGIKMDIDTGVTFYYVSFNMKDKLIGGNKLLRQALSAAVNREQWIAVFTNGTGEKQTTALTPGTLDRPTKSVLKYDFDLARARDLLRKAGYPDGQGLPTIRFDMRGADSKNRQMGDMFAQQYSAIGVKLDVVYNTFPAYIEKMKQGDLQVSYGGWGIDYPDGENVFQLLYGPNRAPGPNEANYDNPEMNKLYDQMAAMESGPARAAVVQKMDDILQEDCPWALGFYYARYELVQPYIFNFRIADVMQSTYKYLRIDTEARKKFLGLP